MNNCVFGKTMENLRKHRDIKLVTTEKRRIKLEMKKAKVKMNKPISLGMSILDISKTLMYEFWYDYLKPKYRDKGKLCYIDTDSLFLIFLMKTFLKILKMMLRYSLMHVTMIRMIKDHFK